MKNEKKCRSCGKWTDGSLANCVFCDSLIDPIEIARLDAARRKERLRIEKLSKESRFERYLRKLEESDRPFHQLTFRILRTAFTIYMAILSFFIWLVALLSG